MFRRIMYKNLMSFKDEQIFDFEIMKSTNIDKLSHYNSLSNIERNDDKSKLDVNISNIILIYGKNNSGKTCFYESFKKIYDFIMFGRNKLVPYALTCDDPIEFELEFFLEETVIRYGAVIANKRVVKEWMYFRKDMSNRESVVYERIGNEIKYGPLFNKHLSNVNEDDFQNDSILHLTKLLNADIHFFNKIGHYFSKLEFFVEHEERVEKDLPIHKLGMIAGNHDLEHELSTVLRLFDTNVKKIKVEKLDEDLSDSLVRLTKIMKDFDFEKLHRDTVSNGSELKKRVIESFGNLNILSDLAKLNFVATSTNVYSGEQASYTFKCEMHDKVLDQSYFLDYKDLSFGTRRIMTFVLNVLLSDDAVLFVDEIEQGLHPMALSSLISYVIGKTQNRRMQFIMSSHAIELLDEFKISNEAKILLSNDSGTSVNYVSEFPFRYAEKVSSKLINGAIPGAPNVKI